MTQEQIIKQGASHFFNMCHNLQKVFLESEKVCKVCVCVCVCV